MAVNVKICAVTGMLWGQPRRNGSDKVLSRRMVKMLQQRLGTVKIYSTPIPLLHPHTEPYRYLGVDIIFNWAPHLDRVRRMPDGKAMGYSCPLCQSNRKLKHWRLSLAAAWHTKCIWVQ